MPPTSASGAIQYSCPRRRWRRPWPADASTERPSAGASGRSSIVMSAQQVSRLWFEKNRASPSRITVSLAGSSAPFLPASSVGSATMTATPPESPSGSAKYRRAPWLSGRGPPSQRRRPASASIRPLTAPSSCTLKYEPATQLPARASLWNGAEGFLASSTAVSAAPGGFDGASQAQRLKPARLEATRPEVSGARAGKSFCNVVNGNLSIMRSLSPKAGLGREKKPGRVPSARLEPPPILTKMARLFGPADLSRGAE